MSDGNYREPRADLFLFIHCGLRFHFSTDERSFYHSVGKKEAIKKC